MTEDSCIITCWYSKNQCARHQNCLFVFLLTIHQSREDDFKEIMHIHFMTYMATPWHKTPSPVGMTSIIKVYPSLVIITLYLVCLVLVVEKKIVKEIIHFHYITYMAASKHMNHCPRGHWICNWNRIFISNHYNILFYFLSMPTTREEDF